MLAHCKDSREQIGVVVLREVFNKPTHEAVADEQRDVFTNRGTCYVVTVQLSHRHFIYTSIGKNVQA